MKSEKKYKDQIRKYSDWEQLRELWADILARKRMKNWPPGKAFEYLILRAFELSGASVRYPFSVELFEQDEIEQIDGVAHFDNISIVVESKNYTDERLNVEPIAKLRNQLMRRPSNAIGCVFCSTGFTSPAVMLAHFCAPQTILLWEKEEITFVLENENLREAFFAKYHYCIETGDPNLKVFTKFT